MKIVEVDNNTILPSKNKSYTICLNMIVKNESHIIESTLENLCNYVEFDYWVVSDTGSTDDTIEVIKEFFRKRGIPGEIEQTTWRDFGFNRTLALNMAFNKTDYLMIFDADDKIHGDFKMPTVLTKDAYQLKLGTGFVYLRTLIVNNRKRWRFVGVLHEYITCIDHEESSETIEGAYYVESGRSGSRNKDPNKYINDATVLERGYNEEMAPGGDRGLAERYAFYCAQSYMDAGPAYMEKSIDWYKRVLNQNNWLQEKYYSALCIGNMYSRMGDTLNAIKYWIKTSEYDEERIEGVASAMELMRLENMHVMVNALYHKYKNYVRYPKDKLFLSQDKYHDVMEYNNSISAYYIFDKQSGYDTCKHIIINNIMPHHYMTSTLGNLGFYRKFFDQDNDEESLRLFFALDNLLADVASKSDGFDNDHYDMWTMLFGRHRKTLAAASEIIGQSVTGGGENAEYKIKIVDALGGEIKKVRRAPGTPRVVITFTTCKRWDLFQETVNSILNMWVDVSQIDYWYCVDDNSSEDDRSAMMQKYPWIDYYMKTEEEKGHRESMNLIWNKLNELKPQYWIHMEDDFLFHSRQSYINQPIQMLRDAAEYNVKQILYNRNYGETIKDYGIQGHRMIRNVPFDVAVHVQKEGQFPYGNNHYWPHYSFRPSFIEASAILILGNYDSENQFFEMDYANRWVSAGYRSGFYNRITNRHIGRLTSERHIKTLPNAYELNNTNQFTAPTVEEIASLTKPTVPVVNGTRKYFCPQFYDDGFGAQFQRYIWTCVFVEDDNNVFVYRPITAMAHNYNNDPRFLERMENLMNMKSNFINLDKITQQMPDVNVQTAHFYDLYKHVERNIDGAARSATMQKIKRFFWANKQRQSIFGNDATIDAHGLPYFHISMHIRRPNVDDNKTTGTDIKDEYYVKTMNMVKAKYDNGTRHVIVHIYSQGKPESYEIYNPTGSEDIKLHLNESVEDTFLGMAGADALITSGSSFSYIAAFMSDGDIYYTKFWHPPCSWWTILDQ